MAKHCRIIVKRIGSDLFYKLPDTWVEDRWEAFDFDESSKAVLFCKDQKVKDVVIIMDFGNPEFDVQLPLL